MGECLLAYYFVVVVDDVTPAQTYINYVDVMEYAIRRGLK